MSLSSALKKIVIGRKRGRTTSDLDGLARTEVREDGTYGLTLAVSLAQYTGVVIASAQSVPQAMSGGVVTGQDTMGGDTGEPDKEEAPGQGMFGYAAADLGTDPFTLEVGGHTSLTGELRASLSKGELTAVYDVRVTGDVYVLQRKSLGQGQQQIVVELDATFSASLRVADQTKDKTERRTVRLGLVRQGDADTGRLMIDDPAFDTTSPFGQLDWEGEPTLATLSMVLAEAAGRVMMQQMASVMAFKDDKQGKDGGEQQAFSFGQTEGGEGDPISYPLATARALSEAPAPGSALGARGLNVLVTLSEASDDPAFLVRARRRLFPALEDSGRQQVQAVLDWVMFRRLRPTFCPPVCTASAPAVDEAFQVFHLRAKSAKELKAIEAALDKGQAELLADFDIRPVGVLRYRDDSIQPQEPASMVLGMWAQAKPGPKVALARVWETRPTTGQGWQNHFRVRAMLDQIASLTEPPLRGDGSVATLPKPLPLGAGGLDGGMLIITTGEKAVVANKHRVLLMDNGLWGDAEPTFQEGDTAGGWKELGELVQADSEVVRQLVLEVKDNALTAAQVAQLVDLDKDWVQKDSGGNNPYQRTAYRLEGQTIGAGEKPQAQTEAIADALKAQLGDVYQIAGQTDLGDGADMVTVIVYDRVQPQ